MDATELIDIIRGPDAPIESDDRVKMNAHDLIDTLQKSGAITDAQLESALLNNGAMEYIFNLPRYDKDDPEIVTAHYKALRIIKTAYKIVNGLGD